MVGRQGKGPWEVGQGLGQIEVVTERAGTGSGTKVVDRGESTGRGLGMGKKCGQNGGVYGHKILWTSGVRTLRGNGNKGWGESVLNCEIHPPPPPQAPPPQVVPCNRNLPDPEKSKSISVTWATSGGDASVALRTCQPSFPSCGLRSLVRASATRVHTDAGGSTCLPLRG